MRAARFHRCQGHLRSRRLDEPSEWLGPHQVLVEPRWTGICGTVLHEYTRAILHARRRRTR